MNETAKKIRFINSHYQTLFEVNDGDEVVVEHSDGYKITKACKFIDEYHFYYGTNCYHICQFAETMERNQSKYYPAKTQD